MDVNMFVGSAQSQASSASTKSQLDQQSYQTMIQALQQFVGEGRLNSSAYNNGKRFYSAVLVPLVKAGILLSEAVGEACQKFVQDYQSTVDSGDLKSEELREKIRQLEFRISHLESIRSTIEGNDLPDNFKLRQLNQNSQAREALIDSKQVLQDKLDKLLEFNVRSPEIFSAISELESIVDQGTSQAGGSWTGSCFSIPTDLGWTTTVSEKWQIRADNIKKQEKEFHEAKIKKLEKYNIYAWPYEDPVTKEIKVNWFIDKNGVRVFDDELQNYVEKYGKKLEGMYEIVGWEKIYELDLAARRKGDGKNYLTEHQVPKGWEWYSQTGAHVESAYWYASKTGLLDLALLAGLSYANSKTQTTATTSKNVTNVLDDLDDVTTRKSTPTKVIDKIDDIPERPSWRQSEIDAGEMYPDYSSQKSFLNGEEVKHGTKNSSRPEYFKSGHSVEVKNYKIDTTTGRSNLANNVSKQVNERINNLPQGTSQTIIVDVRGQTYTNDILDDIVRRITEKCNISVEIKFME